MRTLKVGELIQQLSKWNSELKVYFRNAPGGENYAVCFVEDPKTPGVKSAVQMGPVTGSDAGVLLLPYQPEV
jgi:hypothetical protein